MKKKSIIAIIVITLTVILIVIAKSIYHSGKSKENKPKQEIDVESFLDDDVKSINKYYKDREYVFTENEYIEAFEDMRQKSIYAQRASVREKKLKSESWNIYDFSVVMQNGKRFNVFLVGDEKTSYLMVYEKKKYSYFKLKKEYFFDIAKPLVNNAKAESIKSLALEKSLLEKAEIEYIGIYSGGSLKKFYDEVEINKIIDIIQHLEKTDVSKQLELMDEDNGAGNTRIIVKFKGGKEYELYVGSPNTKYDFAEIKLNDNSEISVLKLENKYRNLFYEVYMSLLTKKGASEQEEKNITRNN